MHALEVIQSAKPGDTVKISLRGPHTKEELEEIDKIHSEAYPHINFEFSFNDDVIRAEIDSG